MDRKARIMTPQEQPDSQAGDKLKQLEKIVGDGISQSRSLYKEGLIPASKKRYADIFIELSQFIEDYAERLATERAIAELEKANALTQGGGKHWRCIPINYFSDRIAALYATLTKEKQ